MPEDPEELEETQTSPQGTSQDDPLASVRRELMDEQSEAEQAAKKPGFINKLKKATNRLRTNPLADPGPARPITGPISPDDETVQALLAVMDMQAAESTEPIETETAPLVSDEPFGEIAALVSVESARDAEAEEDVQKAAESESLAPIGLPPVVIHPEDPETSGSQEEAEIEQSSQPVKPKPEHDENYQSIREVALDEFIEPEVDETQQSDNRFRKLLRLLTEDFTRSEKLIFSGVLLLVLVAFAWMTLYVQGVFTPEPEPTPTFSISLPRPVMITMPGGWAFNLRVGNVEDGQWTPKGAEWLRGTEVCRWVALPWSIQLESVIRTLHADDEIVLSMSNTDQLTYKVVSLYEVPVTDISTLSKNEPCLLVILTEQGSDNRWVVTAVP